MQRSPPGGGDIRSRWERVLVGPWVGVAPGRRRSRTKLRSGRTRSGPPTLAPARRPRPRLRGGRRRRSQRSRNLGIGASGCPPCRILYPSMSAYACRSRDGVTRASFSRRPNEVYNDRSDTPTASPPVSSSCGGYQASPLSFSQFDKAVSPLLFGLRVATHFAQPCPPFGPAALPFHGFPFFRRSSSNPRIASDSFLALSPGFPDRVVSSPSSSDSKLDRALAHRSTNA